MSIVDQELLSEFVIESQEHLSDVENHLLTLESQGAGMDVALVNTVFRAVHSIKGAAGFMGLEVLQGLAHREEEILNKLRNKELRPTHLVIDTLLKATDRLKGLLDEIETSNDQDVSDHLVALERILNGDATDEDSSLEVLAAEVPATAESNAEAGLCGDALREFLVESYECLEQLERDLMTLETEPTSEVLINAVFRSIHTIKGTAGFLGFGKLEKLTHVAETLLGDVRSGQLKMGADISSALLQAVDKVRELLQSIEAAGVETECGSDSLAHALTKLHEILLPAPPKGTPKASHKKQSAASTAPTSTSAAQKTATSAPATTSVSPDVVPAIQSGNVALAGVAQKSAADSPNAAAVPLAPQVAAPPAQTAQPSPVAAESSAADSTIRVDVALLDRLMTCVGELVLARNQILQFANGNVENELYRTSQRLNLITSELQESVMKTRMQPIGNVWSKFPRLVRDLAGICEKQVRIEMQGKETELDKTIIEAIKDPLTHLVRNTVDHGIERAEVRLENGKPAEGCLTLRAYHEGGQVNIEICDDGSGVNPEKVKAKALEKGLVTSEQLAKMSDRDVGNLIFLPGFSTAEKVSNVSGRGVGMDVVKTNIEKIGGTVDLQSQFGVGTTVKIKIPLTLAIIPALIVTCDKYRYAIPQVNLLELVRLDSEKIQDGIEWIQSAPVYRLRGRLLPLVYLREQLKLAPQQDVEALNIVVLKADDRQFGLVVDRINDSEEIVVKPISQHLKCVPVYSGTTIMGDGQVALILDVLGLAQTAKVVTAAGGGQKLDHQEQSHAGLGQLQSLLVAGVGETKRIAINLSQVTRLEKLAADEVEMAGHQEVVQYRGEILTLIRLGDVLGIATPYREEGAPLDVIVYSEGGRSVGIVVDRIIDIVDQTLEITKQTQMGGCTTSAVIQGHVTDLIDLPSLVSQLA